MRKCLFWIIGFLFAITAFSQNPFVREDNPTFSPPLSPRTVGYRISAILDTESHIISGNEKIYFFNNGKKAIDSIKMHLYLNAFSSNQTPMAGAIRPLRRMLKVPVNRKTIGYCRILKLTVNFASVRHTLEVNNTVAAFELPYPLKPGESALIEIEFETRLPRLVVRSGYAGTFHMIAQWFPKLGVLRPDGSWDCPQYGANGEFFSDFGVYDVTLNVPKGFDVIATGILEQKSTADNRNTFHFYAEDVHDFVAAAWDRFKFRKRKIGNCQLTVAYPPGHEAVSLREMDALEGVYRWYTDHIGNYPYSAYTVIDTPFCALAASGMEYPMISTGFALKLVPKWFRLPEETVVHEFGHSYFQGMLASNEFREAWVDEGINTYMTALIMESLYGKCNFNTLKRFCSDGFDRMLNNNYSALRYQKPDQPADTYTDRNAYTEASYNKVAMLLKTMENLIGKDKIIEIMKDYFNKFQFTHPKGSDFIKIFNNHTDNQYAELMDIVIHRNSVPDAAVLRVTRAPLPAFKGFVPEKTTYMEAPETKKTIRYTVVMGKHALPIPVPYRITFSDGSIQSGELSAGESTKTIIIDKAGSIRLIEARIDPERKILIDMDRSDNRYGNTGTAAQKMGTSALFLTVMELCFYVF
ncbi:MAG: M1 family metallopeptidase [Acidobacteria bacterium]|nr:M1 family metallopeptidase [Acidobacteriota bacterium]